MKYITCIRCCIILLFAATAANAQVSFTIRTSSPEIYKNDVLQVEYTITNASSVFDFTAPVFAGWEVQSGPIPTEQNKLVNGKNVHFTIYQYMLKPQKTGKLTLPAASALINNHHQASNVTSVQVIDQNNPSPSSAPPSSAAIQSLMTGGNTSSVTTLPVLNGHENPVEKIRSNNFIKIITSKSRCYVGEPVMVIYKFYRAFKSKKATIVQQPPFTGCSVKEIAFDTQSVREIYDGKQYLVRIVRQVELTPLKAGRLILDSAVIDDEVEFSLADKNMAKAIFKAIITNKPQYLEVEALPGQSRPADFSGITGNFIIKAKAKDNNIPAEENNSLVVTISGKGNITNINAPAVQWPSGLEHFEATMEEQIVPLIFPTEGARTFAYHFVAPKEGDYVIPPVKFSYFNIEKKHYETLQTDSIRFHFRKAIKKDWSVFAQDDDSWVIWVVILLLLITGGFGGWWFYRKRRRTAKAATAKIIAPAPAPVIPHTKTDFIISFDMLSRIEDHYLFFNKSKDILALAISEMVHTYNVPFPALLTALSQHTAFASLEEDCKQLYEDCNVSMYSPGTDSSDKTLVLDKLKQILQAFHLLP